MHRHIEATATAQLTVERAAEVLAQPWVMFGAPVNQHGEYGLELEAELRPGSSARQEVTVVVGMVELTGDGVRCPFSWTPAVPSRLLPRFEGELAASGSAAGATTITVSGTYVPPLGPLGAAADAMVMHRVAASTVGALVADLGRRLDACAERSHTGWHESALGADDLRPLPSEHWLG
jgi:hypothetical protein